MKSIGFIHIEQDDRYAIAIRSSWHLAKIATYIKAVGLNVKLYTGKPTGRMQDLARQLMRMRTDSYLLTVTPDVVPIVALLASIIRQSQPNAGFIFVDTADTPDDDAYFQLVSFGQLISGKSTERAALRVLESVGKAADFTKNTNLSPYLSGVLQIGDVTRLGLMIGNGNNIAQEMHWLKQQVLSKDQTVPIDALNATDSELFEFAQQLVETNVDCGIRLTLKVERCTANFINALPRHLAIDLVLVGDLDQLPEGRGEKHRFRPAETEKQRHERNISYGINGIILMEVGYYPEENPMPGIVHLRLPAALGDSARDAAVAWAAPHMNLKSAAVITSSATDAEVLENVGINDAGIGSWPRHIYAINLASDEASSTVTFDGNVENRQRLRHVGFSRLEEVDMSSDIPLIALANTEDIEAFESSLKLFHEKGRIQLPMRSMHIENTCRWLKNGGCQQQLLRRIEITPIGGVVPCPEGKEIGRVGDSFDQLVINVNRQMQIQEVQRNCGTCPVRIQCSRCTQLSENLGGRYCEIRQNYPHASLYIELFSFGPSLRKFLMEAEKMLVQVRVSYTDLPQQHCIGTHSNPRAGRRPMLLTVGEQHFAWWRGTSRLIRLSPTLALLTEAWWSQVEYPWLVAELAQRFDANEQFVESQIQEGFRRLTEYGVTNV